MVLAPKIRQFFGFIYKQLLIYGYKSSQTDLPEDLDVGNRVAIDCEFMGLNFQRDKLCLVQISSGNSDAHIVQLDRSDINYYF